MLSRLKNVLLYFCLIAFGLVMGLVCLELALRTYEYFSPSIKGTEFASLDDLRRKMLQPPSGDSQDLLAKNSEVSGANLRAIINPHPDDKIIFDLKPNLDLIFQRVPVHTNSCGMRDKERSVIKPENTYRIALLGDSFAFGWGVEEDKIFARRLENNLNEIAQGKINFEVLNFGVPGYSTFQEVAKFKETGLDFNPDAVLVFFVQNDFGLPFYVKNIYRPGGMLAATEFARLSWKAIDPEIEQQRLQLLGYDPNTALRELSDICREKGIKLFISFNPRKDWVKDRNRLWILKNRKDIQIINFRPNFLGIVQERNIPEADLTLTFDPHPSALRHGLYGDLLTPYFMEAIQ